MNLITSRVRNATYQPNDDYQTMTTTGQSIATDKRPPIDNVSLHTIALASNMLEESASATVRPTVPTSPSSVLKQNTCRLTKAI